MDYRTRNYDMNRINSLMYSRAVSEYMGIIDYQRSIKYSPNLRKPEGEYIIK